MVEWNNDLWILGRNESHLSQCSWAPEEKPKPVDKKIPQAHTSPGVYFYRVLVVGHIGADYGSTPIWPPQGDAVQECSIPLLLLQRLCLLLDERHFLGIEICPYLIHCHHVVFLKRIGDEVIEFRIRDATPHDGL